MMTSLFGSLFHYKAYQMEKEKKNAYYLINVSDWM